MSLARAGRGQASGAGSGLGCWEALYPAGHPGPGRTRTFHPREQLPYSRAGVLVEQSSVYIKVDVRLVLTFLWNREDGALVRTPRPRAPAHAVRAEPPRGWSCPSSTLSWSWTPSMPTRHVVCVVTSTGSGLSTSSTPIVSAPWGGRRPRAGLSPGGLEGPGGDLTHALGREQIGVGAILKPATPQREVSGALGTRRRPRAAIPHADPSVLQRLHAEPLPTDARLTPLQFGNLQKLDGPTEQCQDPLPPPTNNCTDRVSASRGLGGPQPLLPQVSGFPGWCLRRPGERAQALGWQRTWPPLWRHAVCALSPPPTQRMFYVRGPRAAHGPVPVCKYVSTCRQSVVGIWERR